MHTQKRNPIPVGHESHQTPGRQRSHSIPLDPFNPDHTADGRDHRVTEAETLTPTTERYHLPMSAASLRLQEESDGTEDGGQTGTGASSSVHGTSVVGGLGGGSGRSRSTRGGDQRSRGHDGSAGRDDGGGGHRGGGRAVKEVDMVSLRFTLECEETYHWLHWVTVEVSRGRVTV